VAWTAGCTLSDLGGGATLRINDKGCWSPDVTTVFCANDFLVPDYAYP